MYLEKRKVGKKTKYYLVHSYRNEKNKVIKLRRFLGSNLSEQSLSTLKKEAENSINTQIESMQTAVFAFSLSDKQIALLNKHTIEVQHFSEKQWKLFTEEFVYNTNAIEGSTIPHNEIAPILAGKRTHNDEELETIGVAKAIDFIRTTKAEFSLNLILQLHLLCFEKSKSFAGKFRAVEVVIRDRAGNIIHRGTPVEELQKELKELIAWYFENKNNFKPLVLAAIIHNQFEDIHPFQDGNGRVGRLLLNYILLKHNYPPINILLKDRAEYYFVLQEYQQRNKLLPTLKFLVRQYKKTLKQVGTKNKK